MTDEMLDALARQVLLDASELGCSDAEQAEEQHTFSPSFERKMKKLIRRADHPVRHRVTQAVACTALVIFLGGGSVLAFSAEARAAVFGWVREVYETYFSYHYEGGETEVPENTVFKPTWIPEGYTETVAPEPGDSVTNIYENETGDFIIFCYTYDSESTALNVERDGSETQQVFIGDVPAELYVNRDEGEGDTLVWTDEYNGILCWITADLSVEELVRIAGSVELVDLNQAAIENTVFLPTWVPEGYELTTGPEPGEGGHMIYQNEMGLIIFISYFFDTENYIAQVELDGVELLTATVNGIPADFFYDEKENESSVLVWHDEEIGVMFSISAPLPQEDIIRVAESIAPVSVSLLTLENAVLIPTWLPTGYKMTKAPERGKHATSVYWNDKGDGVIAITYSMNSESTIVEVERDQVEVQRVFVGDWPADLYLDKDEGGTNILIWENTDIGALCRISSTLPQEDMIRIAERLELMPVVQTT